MTAPVNPPINTLVFEVMGTDEADLHREAKRKLDQFCENPDEWVYGIDAEAGMGTGTGETIVWRGEVTALKRTT